MHRVHHHRHRGVSLVECAIAVAVSATALGLAVPNLTDLRDRHRLDGVAAQLETDLMLARSEAVARNDGVRLDLQGDAAGSCYVLHDGRAGDCRCTATELPVCRAGVQAIRHARFPAAGPIQVSSRSASIVFDPALGTVTPTATIKVSGAAGTVHQVINIMGRVRSCVPAPGRAGYPTC